MVRALPVPVPLVAQETLTSYLARIATANHLSLRELRAHLGTRTRTQPLDLDRLATVTGQPAERLRRVLVDAIPPPGHSRLALLTGRPACRHCTASRGIPGDVFCANVDRRVCRRHRRWLGNPIDDIAPQPDVAALPELFQAQQRHYRLLRRHGKNHGRKALGEAEGIIDGWTKEGLWGEHRQRRLVTYLATEPTPHPELFSCLQHMANYPEAVTLAAIVVSPHWSTLAAAYYRRQRLPFEREVSRRLKLTPAGFYSDDPLIHWEIVQLMIRHKGPYDLEPEAWIAGIPDRFEPARQRRRQRPL